MAIFTPELLQKLKLGYYFWPIFFVGSLIYSVIYYFINLWQMRKNLKIIPGPSTASFLGNSFSFIGQSWADHWKITTDWLDKYHGLLQIWIFHRPTILTSRSDIVERLLKGLADTLTTRNEQQGFLSNYIGGGLLSKTGVDWHQRRKLLTPYFHQDTAIGNLSKICYHARALTSQLKEKTHNQGIVDLQQFVQMSTVDVTTDLLMKSTQTAQENKSYVEANKSATETIMKRTYTPFFGCKIFHLFTVTKLMEMKAARIISNLANKIIDKRIKARQLDQKRIGEDHNTQSPSSFLDFLLDKQDKELLTKYDVKQEVKTFIFAAHESVSSGIAFTLYLIGRHPKIQEQLMQEIKSTLPDLNLEKELTLSQLNGLKQLERSIMESLRLFPPVPWIGRHLKNAIKIDESCTFPADVNVAINIFKLHRNEKHFKNPNQFDPDRFLNYEQESESYTYIPFGAGWRSCIGQKLAMLEMKLIISHILNEYSISSLDKPEDLEITGNIILRSANGLRVQLHPRNK